MLHILLADAAVKKQNKKQMKNVANNTRMMTYSGYLKYPNTRENLTGIRHFLDAPIRGDRGVFSQG